MKAMKLFLAIAVLFLAAIACMDTGTQTPPVQSNTAQAPTAQSGSSGIISQVVMAKGAAPDTAAPVDPTTTFDSKAVIHAVVEINNAPANTKFTASWYVVDVGSASPANTLINSADLTADGTRDLDFTLTPKTEWPSGKYRVDISVNGQLDQSVAYTVQ